jgi:formate transporter
VSILVRPDNPTAETSLRQLVDAPIPIEMAHRAEEIGVTKVRLPLVTMAALGVLAGAFISLGAMLSTVVTAGTGLSFGIARLLSGLVFSLGLVLVVVSGAELFTGNNLIVMAFASKRVSLTQLLRNWLIVYVANFAGALLTALLVFWSGQFRSGSGLIGKRALEIAQTKTMLSTRDAILLGVLANTLVCLAVWMCLAARSVSDKVVAIIGPITAFVAAGFEHSIANMYFIPMGIFVKRWAPASFWTTSGQQKSAFTSVTWKRFFVSNLIPVTIGNIIGGAVMVGIVYWFIYLRDSGQNRHPRAEENT